MFKALKREWHSLATGHPGDRFQRVYRNRKERDRPFWQKAASMVVGLVIIAVGLVALPAPGPGTLVLVLGFGIVARELRFVARALDWTEVRLRLWWQWLKRTWKNASGVGRVALAALGGTIALGFLAVAALLVYRMIA